MREEDRREAADAPRPRRLVIGLGNRFRGDDAAGLLAARLAREGAPPGASVLEWEGEPLDLPDAWEGAERVVLLDAVVSGSPPGTLHRFDAGAGPLPAGLFRLSTHAVSAAEAIELARALGRLPRRLVLYGIEGREFRAGAPLTPEVEAAAGEAASRALREVRDGPG